MKFKNIGTESLRVAVDAGRTSSGTPYTQRRNIRVGEVKDIKGDAIKSAIANPLLNQVVETTPLTPEIKSPSATEIIEKRKKEEKEFEEKQRGIGALVNTKPAVKPVGEFSSNGGSKTKTIIKGDK